MGWQAIGWHLRCICNFNSCIKTSWSGNKGDQKWQTAEQLWQKNGNCVFNRT